MTLFWDVIVVGARCSGATLATLLARKGLKVALLDTAPRGTDMPMSTHLLHSPGVAVLDLLGVGDRVRAVAPPTRRFRLALDDTEAIVPTPEGRAAYCIRRSLLDPWLQQAAEESGATLLDHHHVVDLLRAESRIVGVVAHTPAGIVELRGALVVGADGPHSTVAACTEAEEYMVSEGARAGYWSYYPAPATWTENWDATLEHLGDGIRYVFRCDSQRVLLCYMGPRETVAAWGREYQAHMVTALQRSKTTRALCEGKTAVGKTIGLRKFRSFYRQPVGPGWRSSAMPDTSRTS